MQHKKIAATHWSNIFLQDNDIAEALQILLQR